jgi:membrane-anchored protein YejM (alkaline phosphatase superfamily)
MILNALASEGSEDSLRLGAGTYMTAILIVIVTLFLEFILIRNLHNKLKDRSILPKTIPLVLSLGLLFTISDKLTYAVADLYNRCEVTRYGKVFPVYQPMTIKRFMRKKFNFKVDREETFQFDNTHTGLNYPKKELNQSYCISKPNIVWKSF